MRDEIDTRDIGKVEGFDVRAFTAPDDLGRPFDEYGEGSAYDIAEPWGVEIDRAWLASEWWWITVGVEASLGGVVIGTTYLGGIESGDFPMFETDGTVTGSEWIDPLWPKVHGITLGHDAETYGYPLDDMIGEAIGEARGWLNDNAPKVAPLERDEILYRETSEGTFERIN